MDDNKTEITQRLVKTSAELGVEIVKEVASAVLVAQPSMSLRQFLDVMDAHISNAIK